MVVVVAVSFGPLGIGVSRVKTSPILDLWRDNFGDGSLKILKYRLFHARRIPKSDWTVPHEADRVTLSQPSHTRLGLPSRVGLPVVKELDTISVLIMLDKETPPWQDGNLPLEAVQELLS